MTSNKTTNYEQQAIDFAQKHGITLTVGTPTFGIHFAGDKDKRYTFPCKIKRKGQPYSYNFQFGQSIQDGNKAPTLYDVFACIQKYEVGDYEDFCKEFGYEIMNDAYTGHNKESKKIYNAVCKEYEGMLRVCGEDILTEMQDIN